MLHACVGLGLVSWGWLTRITGIEFVRKYCVADEGSGSWLCAEIGEEARRRSVCWLFVAFTLRNLCEVLFFISVWSSSFRHPICLANA